jgi:hypothetical protein
MLQMRLIIPHRDRDIVLNGWRGGRSRSVRVPDQFKCSCLLVRRSRILHGLFNGNREILCNDIRFFNGDDFELCVTDKTRLLTAFCAQMASFSWVRRGFLQHPLTCTRINSQYTAVVIVFPIKHHLSQAREAVISYVCKEERHQSVELFVVFVQDILVGFQRLLVCSDSNQDWRL